MTTQAMLYNKTQQIAESWTIACVGDQQPCMEGMDTILLYESGQISNKAVHRPPEMLIVNTLFLRIHESERISNNIFQERACVNSS